MGVREENEDGLDPAVLAALGDEAPGERPAEPPERMSNPPDRATGPVRRKVVRAGAGRPPAAAAQPEPPVPAGPFPSLPHIQFGPFPGIYLGVASTVQGQEASLVWGAIVEELREIQVPIDAVAIKVFRMGVGAVPSPKIRCEGDIDGPVVAGADGISAGQALTDYVVNVFQQGCPHPMKYELDVYWKRNTSTIRKNLQLMLQAWPEIIAQRNRTAAYLAHQQQQRNGMGATGFTPPSPGYGPPVQTYGRSESMYPSHPTYPGAPWQLQIPQPQYGSDPGIESIRRELAATMGRTDELVKILREQNVPVPVAPSPPQPVVTKEDIVKTVMEVMKVMMPATPATAVAAAVPAATDPMAAMTAMVQQFEQMEKIKARMATVMGVDPDAEPEPPPPPPPVAAQLVEDKPPFGITPLPFTSFGDEKKPINYPTGVEGGWVEWTKAFLASNPDITIAGFKVVAHIIDRGVIGQVVQTMQAKGNPQQQAVAQQAVREGLVNGVANVQPQPPPAPPEPWAPTG